MYTLRENILVETCWYVVGIHLKRQVKLRLILRLKRTPYVFGINQIVRKILAILYLYFKTLFCNSPLSFINSTQSNVETNDYENFHI